MYDVECMMKENVKISFFNKAVYFHKEFVFLKQKIYVSQILASRLLMKYF